MSMSFEFECPRCQGWHEVAGSCTSEVQDGAPEPTSLPPFADADSMEDVAIVRYLLVRRVWPMWPLQNDGC
jgi:hypothetical protein